MVKVIFTSGREANFHGSDFTANSEGTLFFIPNRQHPTIMIPAASVECIGIWDKEEGEFYQRGYCRSPEVPEDIRLALESLTGNE